MSTPYSKANQDFSDEAHKYAQDFIYPKLFNTDRENLSFECTSLGTSDKNKILDGEMATDRIVRVTVDFLHGPIQFTVQERYRKPEYARWKDITITEWNCATNLPSELYKLNAGIFVYGYFDDIKKVFLDWVGVNTVGLLLGILSDTLAVDKKTNPRSGQTFFGVSFYSLRKSGLLISEKNITGQMVLSL